MPIMITDAKKLGELLRKRREELRLSLKEIENGTSIRTSYLQSLEDGNIDDLISPVYAQGFLRKYADFLQVDEKQLLAAHPQVESQLTEVTEQPDYSSLSSIEVRGTPGRSNKWSGTLVWVGGSSFTVLCLWWIARSLGVF